MALKEIKNKIRSVNKTRKVTKAMEAVSAVKMRKSQERALAGRPYAKAALTILRNLSGSLDAVNHPLVIPRETENKIAMVVITSDKGLAGALNSSVLKEAHKVMKEHSYSKDQMKIITIGKKGYEHFSNRGFDMFANYPSPDENGTLDSVQGLANEIVSAYLDGTYDKCWVVYTNFKSTFEQEAVGRRMLPVALDAVEEVIQGITPEKGMHADVRNGNGNGEKVYTLEPNAEAILSTLIPSLISIEIYHGLLESAASEYSARRLAMKNASAKASEISRDLNLKFNKARQAIITREVSEIVGGMEVSS